jgi:hypothetical protein
MRVTVHTRDSTARAHAPHGNCSLSVSGRDASVRACVRSLVALLHRPARTDVMLASRVHGVVRNRSMHLQPSYIYTPAAFARVRGLATVQSSI